MRLLRAVAGFVVALASMLVARVRSGGESGVVTSSDMAVRTEREGRERTGDGSAKQHELPEKDEARGILEKMLLIRRFEERAGEMYAKAKIGGFLHLCIGEEATVIGGTRALRETDYLMSTYREHGQAIARGTHPNAVMAELFGRVGGGSGGRGGSMHLFDFEPRFLGGYGIVGGNLPLAVGVGLACDYMDTEDAIVCMFGDGASNQGTFGESMNLAALWKLPVVFMVINNQFGMGTSLERHSAVTDLSRKAEGYGVPGSRCDGMDVLDVHTAIGEALRKARDDRQPQLVEAVTYRFRGHSMADPEEYRSKDEVEEWRKRDPITTFASKLDGIDLDALDEEATARIDEAVEFADGSDFPPPESLYDHVYVLGDQVRGWYSVDERSAGVHKGEDERSLAGEERGPEGEYGKAVQQTEDEDVEEEKDADAGREDDD